MLRIVLLILFVLAPVTTLAQRDTSQIMTNPVIAPEGTDQSSSFSGSSEVSSSSSSSATGTGSGPISRREHMISIDLIRSITTFNAGYHTFVTPTLVVGGQIGFSNGLFNFNNTAQTFSGDLRFFLSTKRERMTYLAAGLSLNHFNIGEPDDDLDADTGSFSRMAIGVAYGAYIRIFRNVMSFSEIGVDYGFIGSEYYSMVVPGVFASASKGFTPWFHWGLAYVW